MNCVQLNGISLHYRYEPPPDLPGSPGKSAPVLVFANSLGTDFRVWDGLVEELGRRYGLLRYDKRGHGLSGSTPGPYAVADHVDDLSALIDHLGLERIVMVGLSVGGMIAQGLAGARPDLVSALVLCDTAHKIGPPEMWDQRIAAIEAGGIEALADAIMERWLSAKFRAERPAELAAWRNMLTRTPVEGYLGTCAALRDADLTEVASRISVPTLCIVGSEDGSTPPDLVRSLSQIIPGAEFEVIDGAGHLPCVEAATDLATLLNAFLEQHDLDR